MGLWERAGGSLRVSGVITRESLRSFLANNDFEMSAALATYSFFAIVPLLFFAVNIVGGHGSMATLYVPGIEGLIDHLFPRIRGWMSFEFVAITKHRFTLGTAVIVFVFIAVMSLVDSLRTAFLKIFRKDPPSSLLVAQLKNAQASAVMFLLFLALVTVEVFFVKAFEGFDAGHSVLGTTGSTLVSVCVATLCMAVFYAVFLPVRFTLVKLISASVISAILIIFMREVFALLIKTRPSYGETFGSLKTLFIMIVWVYYCFLVILFGAEIAVHIEKRDALLLKGLFSGQSCCVVPEVLLKKFVIRHQEGDIIFNEGDEGGSMFYIINGFVEISRNGRFIRMMGRGEYFGEMSMLLGTQRSATATVSVPATELIAISQENFDIILGENGHIVLAILKEMAGRLKEADEWFSSRCPS